MWRNQWKVNFQELLQSRNWNLTYFFPWWFYSFHTLIKALKIKTLNLFLRLKQEYLTAVEGIRKLLVRKSKPNNLVFVGELLSGRSFSPKMVSFLVFFPEGYFTFFDGVSLFLWKVEKSDCASWECITLLHENNAEAI